MNFFVSSLSEIRRTFRELCNVRGDADFNQLSRTALYRDRASYDPALLKKGNRIAGALVLGGIAAGAVCASALATPLLVATGLVAAAVVKPVADRYLPARSILWDNAMAEGHSPAEARAHIADIRKLSNGFNAPLHGLKMLSASHLGKPQDEPVGDIHFTGHASKPFREAVVAAYQNVPESLRLFGQAMNVKMHGLQNPSEIPGGSPINRPYIRGLYHQKWQEQTKSSDRRIYIFETTLINGRYDEVSSYDTAYLNGEMDEARHVSPAHTIIHELAHAFGFIYLDKRTRLDSSKPFLRVYKQERAKLGKLDPSINFAHSNKEIFAEAYAMAFRPETDLYDHPIISQYPKTAAYVRTLARSFEKAVQTDGETLRAFLYRTLSSGGGKPGFNSELTAYKTDWLLFSFLCQEPPGPRRESWAMAWRKRAPTDILESFKKQAEEKITKGGSFLERDQMVLRHTTEALAERQSQTVVKRPRRSLSAAKRRHRLQR